MTTRRFRCTPNSNLKGARRRRHRRGFRSIALFAPVMLLLAGFFASTARAEATNTVAFSCTAVTFTYTGFPNLPNNTVREDIFVDTKKIYSGTFTFNGPSGANTVEVVVPAGHHGMDAFTHWKTNGVKGGKDTPARGGVNCAADPGYTIEKLQKFAGSGAYTSSTLAGGQVGQTVDYEIVVKNTGNVPLTFSDFSDSNCDAGTITGGPGEAAVELGGSTTFSCDHVLTEADRGAGTYTNTAMVTGTPPEGDGPPITETSNPVIVELPTPTNTVSFSCTAVTFTFTGFPNLPNNTVKEFIYVDKVKVYSGTFTFNGPAGSNTVKISLASGHHGIDGRTQWKTNGFKGGKDTPRKGGVSCPEPEPGFSIEKLQEVQGSGEGFSSSPKQAPEQSTVDYEIVVRNTGNVPLTFSSFTDERCDEGTIVGGPGESPLAPGESTTYLCRHVVVESAPSTYANHAADTGTPPPGDGEPITHESNTVFVEVT